MAHHLRHDKTCLNCGATVEERFCTRCGQENLEPKETVGHLVRHFFEDITHFDGKFFVTIKDLILRPGFLTREYVAGRRMSYLNPIRMYIFISAVFFITLFASTEEAAPPPEDHSAAISAFRQQLADSLRSASVDGLGSVRGDGAGSVKGDGAGSVKGEGLGSVKGDGLGSARVDGAGSVKGEGLGSVRVDGLRPPKRDGLWSAEVDSLQRAFNGKMAARLDSVKPTKDTGQDLSLNYGSAGTVKIDITENKYSTIREYDSIQRTLADTAKDQGLMHWILRNNVRQKEKHGGRSKVHIEVDVRHDIPKIMFLILPLFALYISWFYNRKKYYYVNHAIFSVHFHCFIFLLFLFMLLLAEVIPGAWTGLILAAISPIPAFVYLVAALRGMYKQSFWLSLGKGAAIGLLYVITLALASTLLLIVTFIMA